MFFTPRKVILLLIDAVIINLSLFLGFMIQFDWNLYGMNYVADLYYSLIIPVTLIRILVFYFFGLYEWSFRYASLTEVLRISAGVMVGTLSVISFAALMFIERFWSDIGRTVLVIDFLVCLFLIGAFRFSFRLFKKVKRGYQLTSRAKDFKKALIIGAGDAGEMVARELLNMKDHGYHLVGFVDDDPRKKNMRIHGVKVLGSLEEVQDISESYGIEEVIIAIPSAKGRMMRHIVEKCAAAGVKLKTVPRLGDILSGKVSVKEIRDVQPEDLLGREEVAINGAEVCEFVQDKVVMITGAGGTIGSELCRQLAPYSPRLLLLFDQCENDVYFLMLELGRDYPDLKTRTVIGDIKDIGLLISVFSRHEPHIIFHAAAHKHVPLMQENPSSAVKNNVLGTRNLLYAAHHYKVEKFVLISTDKAVNPTSVMGASKRVAEILMQAKAKQSGTKFMAVRFGNVIGSNGSVVPIFKRQIEKGGPVTVTHPEVRRYFMTAGEAAQLVIQAGAMGEGGEVFVLDMGEPIKIIDLARNLVILSGLEVGHDIQIKITGLRPAEKLYEEVLHDTEHDCSTKHEKIYIAQVDGNYSLRRLRRELKDLEMLATNMYDISVVEKLAKIIRGQEAEDAVGEAAKKAELGLKNRVQFAEY